MKKSGFTLEQHREVGRDLKEVERLLNKFLHDVIPAYPMKSHAGKALKAVDKAMAALLTIKHEMDEQVHEDFPDLTLKEFVPIYYGSENTDAE